MKTTTVGIYVRVSTTDKGQDIETQLLPLKAFAKSRGWDAIIYQDKMSGSRTDRPELNQMMADVRKRKLDVILVHRFDRFARSTKQLIDALEEFRALGVNFVSYQEAVDTTTPAGKLMFSMISAFAEFEREIIRERVRAGLDRARKQGKTLGRPKVGINREEIIKLKSEGNTYRQIAKILSISTGKICEALKPCS